MTHLLSMCSLSKVCTVLNMQRLRRNQSKLHIFFWKSFKQLEWAVRSELRTLHQRNHKLITLVWYNVTMPTIIVTTSFKECPIKVALLPAALLSLPNPFATLPWEICDRRKNHVSAICKKHIILHVTRIPNQKTPQKQKIIILHNCSLDIIKYIYQDHRTTIKLGLLRWQNSSW